MVELTLLFLLDWGYFRCYCACLVLHKRFAEPDLNGAAIVPADMRKMTPSPMHCSPPSKRQERLLPTLNAAQRR